MSDPHRSLVRALIGRGGEGTSILSSSVADWASMTFEGHRHLFALAGVGAGFAEGIGDAEFRLPGHIVADIAIIAGGTPGTVRIEALTLVDA